MPGGDERDPLDSWLESEVRPLPPPPGTFELIGRRARRRRFRRLAVTVGSAAAVAASVVIAVPGVLALHLNQTTVSGDVAANGLRQDLAPSGGQPERSSRPAGPTAAKPTSWPSGPVPAGFQPTSATFIGQHMGWAIGQAGTQGSCATQYCTSIVRTDDGGRTWTGAPAPRTSPSHGAAGVSEIQFLDGVNGWAFGPELWATHNRGWTWTRVPTGGKQVIDLETAGHQAFAIFATCAGGGSGTAGGTGSATSTSTGCTGYTLERADAGSDNWTPVGPATTALAYGTGTSAAIVLSADRGWMLGPDGTVYSGSLTGTWQRAGTAPCAPGSRRSPSGLGNALLEWGSNGSLIFECATQPQTTAKSAQVTQRQILYASPDGGATWREQGAAPGHGMAEALAASPSVSAILATSSGLEIRPAGSGQWRQVPGTPAGGFSYVGMTTTTQGFAIPVNTALHEIWMTYDGGQSWTPAKILP